jgi:hypothetical protein
MDQRPLFLYLFSSATPQRTANSGVPFQMAAHPWIGSLLQAREIAGFEPRTAGLQSSVATNDPPLLPDEPLLLSFFVSIFTELCFVNYKMAPE